MRGGTPSSVSSIVVAESNEALLPVLSYYYLHGANVSVHWAGGVPSAARNRLPLQLATN